MQLTFCLSIFKTLISNPATIGFTCTEYLAPKWADKYASKGKLCTQTAYSHMGQPSRPLSIVTVVFLQGFWHSVWEFACACVCLHAWRNISPHYAQIQHSWASQYFRLLYVTTCSQPATPPPCFLPSSLPGTLAFKRMHADTTPMTSLILLLFVSLSPSAFLISVSLPRIHIWMFSVLSVRLCVFIQPPHILLMLSSFLLTHTASINACPYAENHWPDVSY